VSNDDIWPFTVTIPAGTPETAPVTVGTVFPTRIVNAIKWRVPAGPSGLMGFYVSMRTTQVFPSIPGQWIIANDESDTWDVFNQPDSGDWSITGYNTGTYNHNVYVTYMTQVMRPRPVNKTIIPLNILGPVPNIKALGPPLPGDRP
jgi:hypothetical protein